MIITEIVGGLGNQLFEYAHARALSIKLDKELAFDLSFFDTYHIRDVFRLHEFNINIRVATEQEITRVKRNVLKPDIIRSIYRKIGGSPYVKTKCHFDNERIDTTDQIELFSIPEIYISGYFADQKYFIESGDIIRREVTLKNLLNSENSRLLSQIKNRSSVSIHIRRCDYVGNHFFAQIPLQYYYKAIDYIERLHPNSCYFIFSDDSSWVKKNFAPKVNLVYVNINNATSDYMDLMLMASCNHNIIANSTFSWWGGWLNINPDKIIIAPKIWYYDKTSQKIYEEGGLVPSEWEKI